MNDISVKKRDGRLEAWSFDKLVTAIGKAGVPFEAAQKIAGNIESWAKTAAQKGVVASTEIRDKVIEFLKEEFPSQADNFQSYKKE
ncbi:hypothetical protein A2865_00240 [Candidatus Woesebacteria bacterium RIFCSPHIGHO2_01_FULL_39_17]|uniref:ATP-cone domain-containing protein n=3 Tax=Candidatus Woeseibacteriota TaxID=1752722 RepID=A0A0G0NDP8_9BACT|nr:MAG: hypothetical protein US72_C0005G0010 [Microgenomates group bacterium GW2011_GWC1_38_12]KKQ94205.1 MAG: hypothetical protein UT19_C0003G0010 [Candidatus Woesebacteria bacterium GW2011_GWB1_39_10b]KKR14269.1 MAG: hypothetical protein UT40_C0003G0011 [Candidatus Woesebacteria bacterium GW2011_GWA1_39_21b]OGM23661.1 MAG: hypothetical protein A2865_00240 [Candidatus Woesebacteria bacterium RIFCSPHIGHO2_01_FULL_39_17]OGM65483.1 MAG: hypothetical protein A3A52_00980 [Candidatus Woesebacteria b